MAVVAVAVVVIVAVVIIVLFLLREPIREFAVRFRDHWLTAACLSTNERKHKALLTYFHVAVDIFNHAGVDFWLDWGTLLGYWRGSSLIPHDYDVDFGFDANDAAKVLASAKAVLRAPLRIYDTVIVIRVQNLRSKDWGYIVTCIPILGLRKVAQRRGGAAIQKV